MATTTRTRKPVMAQQRFQYPRVHAVTGELIAAPVTERAEAARLSDETWLPETVYEVIDEYGDRWFQIATSDWHLYTAQRDVLRIQPLVTFLPTRYFVR